MRQTLHIPLARHHKTTRRSRRVVWLLAICLLLFIVCVFLVGQLWFTRNTVFTAAPEGTGGAVQILLNKKTWPVVQKTLEDIPLISHRDLTLDDLAQFIHGELGWFFHEDGTRSIAIRSDQEKIPTELLDAKHIVVQKVSKSVFLLSEKLQPVSGLPTHRSISSLFPSFATHIGTYRETRNEKTLKISYSNNQIRIALPVIPGAKNTMVTSHIPPDTFFFLSTPVLSNSTKFLETTDLFSGLVDPLLNSSIQGFFKEILGTNSIFLLNNPSNPSFLLVSDEKTQEAERPQIIKTALSLKHPILQEFKMTDGSRTKELISDPSLVPLEEKTIEGRQFHRAIVSDYSLFISKDGDLILSNSEETIRSWLKTGEENKMLMPCDANSGYVSPTEFFQKEAGSSEYYSNDLLYRITAHFESIGLKSKGNKTILTVCI